MIEEAIRVSRHSSAKVRRHGRHRVPLLEMAAWDDLKVRRSAYLYLRALPRNREVELQLIEGLSDRDAEVRRYALEGLSTVNYARRSPIEKNLERLLASDPDRTVRIRAGTALAHFDGRRAIPALERAVGKAATKSEKSAHRQSIRLAGFTDPE